MDFQGKSILVGVSGGIAAYRACDFIRELYRRGATRVFVTMTSSSHEFITPLTLQSLSRYKIFNNPWELDEEGIPLHIAYAQKADAMIILPATANTLAKLAHGFADDPLSTVALAMTGKPLLIAPAMNTRMWHNPATQENIQTLSARSNVSIIPPASGHLACGETGEGHLASPEMMLQALYKALHPQADLFSGVNALVSGGGTYAPIDPVRHITNKSSGKMGLALADELYAMGATVTYIAAQSTVPERPYTIIQARPYEAMQAQIQEHFDAANLTIMAAAISDFKVANPAKDKLKRKELSPFSLTLEAAEDILAGLGKHKQPHQFLVGFAAESQAVLENALKKLTEKHLDCIVANDISRNDIGFQSDENEVTLTFNTGEQYHIDKQPKYRIARELLCLIHHHMATPVNPSSTNALLQNQA